MNIKKISIISLLCLISGIIFFLFYREFIIINFNTNNLTLNKPTLDTPTINSGTHKKELSFYFWHKNSWQEEKKQCLWSDAKEFNLKQVITTWLSTLEQEGVISTKITAQLIALDSTGYFAFLSFDTNPITQNGPFYTKILWIEGLLKTIKNSGINIQSIHFLHNHKPLIDSHLDFSQPWPINGFIPN